VLLAFSAYLAIGIWGITVLKEGLQRKHMVQETSDSYKFYETDDAYFRDYPYQIMVRTLYRPCTAFLEHIAS
jgi:hypothetical protein